MPHIAQHAGAHDRTQLRFEHRDVVQAHADGAVAEEGVLLGVLSLFVGVFVGTEIQRAEHQRAAVETFQGVGVGKVMLFLGWLVIVGEIQKFGAVQADSLGAAMDRIVDFRGNSIFACRLMA